MGNIKNGVIRQGSSSLAGSGSIIGNVEDKYIRKGSSSLAGSGTKIGEVSAYTIKGMESCD